MKHFLVVGIIVVAALICYILLSSFTKKAELIAINGTDQGTARIIVSNSDKISQVKSRLEKIGIAKIIVDYSSSEQNQKFSDYATPEISPLSFSFARSGGTLFITYFIHPDSQVISKVGIQRMNVYINQALFVAIYDSEKNITNRTEQFLKSYEDVIQLGENNYLLKLIE